MMIEAHELSEPIKMKMDTWHNFLCGLLQVFPKGRIKKSWF
jgi:hypothetical protein